MKRHPDGHWTGRLWGDLVREGWGHLLRRVIRRLRPPHEPMPAPPPDADRTPWPARFERVPEHLMLKVNGSRSRTAFEAIGRGCADLLRVEIPGLPADGRVLDFGCGLGRTLRPLRELGPQLRLTGFDIDPVMLEWAGYLLHGAGAELIPSTSDLPDGSFDALCAVSVFTHLDGTADYWLAEIRRLLSPAGRALLTYHDETLLAEMAGRNGVPDLGGAGPAGGRLMLGEGTAEGGAGMAVFYTTEVWERTLSRFLRVERTVPRGVRGHQSFSVVSRGGAEPDWAELRRDYARHLERELFQLRRVGRVPY
jgi:SAM-dependent methyltransferase